MKYSPIGPIHASGKNFTQGLRQAISFALADDAEDESLLTVRAIPAVAIGRRRSGRVAVAMSISIARMTVAHWPVAVVHPVGRRIGHEADLLDLVVHCRLEQCVEFRGFLRCDTCIRDFNGE